MKALVTGATGFVGGHLVDRLLARGDTVTALVRSLERAAPLAARGVVLVPGDLHDLEALRTATRDQAVVYHAAALTGAVDEAEFNRANRDGTANVARACVEHGGPTRFVLVSSMAAGGPAPHGQPRVEGGEDHPVTMYGRSKLASEQVLRELPLDCTILRPPTVYGPRDRENLLAVFRAARVGIAPVFGDGSMELSLIHVGDLARAILAAGTTAGLGRRHFYVNHPEIVTSAGLVRAIGEAIGQARVRLLPVPEWVARGLLTVSGTTASLLRLKTILRADKANEFYQDAWTADPAAFEQATGWRATFDMRAGLADAANWYRSAGLL